MVSKNQADRRELEDVSAATLQGADSFILTQETSIGQYPIQAMNELAKAIAEAENVYDYDQAFVNVKDALSKQQSPKTIDILAHTGCSIAYEQRENVDMFVCLTENGKIARHLAR